LTTNLALFFSTKLVDKVCNLMNLYSSLATILTYDLFWRKFFRRNHFSTSDYIAIFTYFLILYFLFELFDEFWFCLSRTLVGLTTHCVSWCFPHCLQKWRFGEGVKPPVKICKCLIMIYHLSSSISNSTFYQITLVLVCYKVLSSLWCWSCQTSGCGTLLTNSSIR